MKMVRMNYNNESTSELWYETAFKQIRKMGQATTSTEWLFIVIKNISNCYNKLNKNFLIKTRFLQHKSIFYHFPPNWIISKTYTIFILKHIGFPSMNHKLSFLWMLCAHSDFICVVFSLSLFCLFSSLYCLCAWERACMCGCVYKIHLILLSIYFHWLTSIKSERSAS